MGERMTLHAYNPTYLRSKNRGVVLQMFLRQRELSRADITKQSNLTFPTVSNVVADFIQLGLVSETSAVSSGNGLGRKGVLLRLNENAYGTIGIFFEGNHLRVGLVNLLHNVVDCIDYSLQVDPSTPEEYAVISVRMTDAIATLVKAHPQTRVLGVGIGMPGVVDAKNSTFQRWGKLYHFFDFYSAFKHDFELPIFIENDMNAASLGEAIMRDDPSITSLFFLSIGTGTGTGIIMNDRIWHGHANYAGDIGMVMKELDLNQLPEDLCDLRLNNQIRAAAIEKRFGVDIGHGRPCSQEKKREISEYIVSRFLPIIYNINYILDIGNYVLAGSVTEFLGDAIFECVHDHLERLQKMDVIPLKVNVIRSIHHNVGIVGAADIALSHTLPELLA